MAVPYQTAYSRKLKYAQYNASVHNVFNCSDYLRNGIGSIAIGSIESRDQYVVQT